MDKYGVVTEVPKDKRASEKLCCPQCGSEIPEDGGSVIRCPACGTKPFERRAEGADEETE
ncbi:MAG: hypothetical protein DRP42_07640, partial [Tenericutes bacterium]